MHLILFIYNDSWGFIIVSANHNVINNFKKNRSLVK